ncbi:MAG TPA: methylenetetrahydrofolate reductase [NAD(P)H] [Dehalococcoidia bacterium]|nr:methylenetetrahydrofolate reductase [NAD(P)H] [Dehalococcoidia bacterium]
MIRKISDILAEKEMTYSFEFFPPKTEKGVEKLFEVAGEYKELNPDWFTVTYGAGGSTRELTMELVDQFQKRFGVPTMHHFTCVGHSKDELANIIEEMKRRNICNILALRGDPPAGVENWEPAPNGLEYSYQLVELIREHNGFFSVGVAGFPEGHIDCPDKETDTKHLKMKIDAGSDFVITQLFFDNKDYFDYVNRLKAASIGVKVLPGILPITDYKKLIRFCAGCGATIPKRVHDIFRPIDGDEEATYKAGIDFVIEQCNELLDGGAPGLHFYTLNKLDPVREVLGKIRR